MNTKCLRCKGGAAYRGKILATMTDVIGSPAATFQDPTVGLTEQLAQEIIALVRKWLIEGANVLVGASAQQLAGVLKDPQGLDFTVGFVDGVNRPEDLKVAARNLAAIAPRVPAFLPWSCAAVRIGGGMSAVVPQLVIPIARKVLREMVGHLIVDATDAKLGPAIAKIRKDDTRLNVNLARSPTACLFVPGG